MSKQLLKLQSGSRIAVIGGGPAGTLFTLYLLEYARRINVYPEITIYEQRDFNDLGVKGCKGCAGILSLSFRKNLEELGLTLPDEIVQSNVIRYTVHSPYTSISISNPDKETQIVSIYRGGGPRLSHYNNQISFNEWLLNEAKKRNVKIEDKFVPYINLEKKPRIEVSDKLLEFDLVVLATGINAKPVRISGLKYVPPRTQIMSQEEVFVGTDNVEAYLGNMAHAFLIPNSDIIFGTLVPKGPFINVSVLSKGRTPFPVKDFLKHELVREMLPEKYERSCSCRPSVSVGLAKEFYANGFVAIGEAAASRLYKDGIGSSLLTAREAARTAVFHGISKNDFKRYYYPLCRNIYGGNLWGRLLFSINDKAKNSRAFLLAQNRLIGDEQKNIKGPQPFTRAAWGMFSGSYSYNKIAAMTLNPVSFARLMAVTSQEGLKVLFRKEKTQIRKLYVGRKKILILGSGFGGTYVFRHLLPSLNKNENVEITMVSDENFFLFSPLLHEVAMGKIETRHIAFPIRRLHWKDRFDFIQDKVEKINLTDHQVFTASRVFEYDYLVLALGSVTDTSILKSAGKSFFTLKTLNDSMLIRNHIIEMFEMAATEKDNLKRKQLLTFVVCGAGYTGVQVVTELRDFVFRHLSKFYRSVNRDEIRIVLIETERKILAGLPAELSAYALSQLHRMGIEIRFNSQVTDVQDWYLIVNGDERIFTGTVLWVAGVIANPCISSLSVKKDSLGRVEVDNYLELPEARGVFAVGDCAHFEDPDSGQPIPPRAHIAVRQARVVAHNILAEIRGWDNIPYRYSNNEEAVSLGASRAVFRFHNIRIYGLPARLLWIAGYTFLITGVYNRIRILTDWGLSFLFGRDTTLLKLKK